MKKQVSEKAVATLAIQGPGAMTERQRGHISVWLYGLAEELRTNGEQFTEGRFRARFERWKRMK